LSIPSFCNFGLAFIIMAEGHKEKSQAHVAKQVPFGTRSEHYPFSSFNHLAPTDKNFALDLAVTEPPQNEFVAAIIKDVKETASKSKVVLKAGELKELLGQGEEGIEPCTRKECVTIVRKILETQGRNKAERNDILGTEDMLTHEIQSAEQDATMLEEELAVANNESKRLELTLSHLKEQLAKLTKTCKDLQHERDEFSNKVMVIETERQRWVRKLQLADAALQDCIWRGVTSINAHALSSDDHDHNLAKSLRIVQASPATIKEADSVCGTDYKNMVKSGMLDVTEYPTTATTELTTGSAFNTLPFFIQQQILGSSGNNSVRSNRSAKSKTLPQNFSSNQSLDGNASVMSALTYGSANTSSFKSFKRGMAGSHSVGGGSEKTRYFKNQIQAYNNAHGVKKNTKKLPKLSSSQSLGGGGGSRSLRNGAFGAFTNPMDGGIVLDLPPGTFKGYTPTGSPINRDRRSRMSNNGNRTASTVSTSLSKPSSVRFSADQGLGLTGTVDMGDNNNSDDEMQLDSLDGSMSTKNMEYGHELGSTNSLAPVFYSEKARTRWGRKAKIGGLVVRNVEADHTYHNSRRKLLTSLGHPDVFNGK
jgi:hypothetical protein